MNLSRISLGVGVILSTAFLSSATAVRVLIWDEQQPEQKQVYTNFLGNHIADNLRKNSAFEVASANLSQPNQGLSEEILDKTDVLVWWGHRRYDDVPQKIADAIVDRVKTGRLSLVALHSADWSAPFRTAMEARLIQETVKMLPVGERAKAVPEFIQWRSYAVPSRSEKPGFDTRIERREDGKWHVLIERPSCVFPGCCTPMQPSTIRTLLPKHPIASGVPAKFTLPETEMYDEPFHVPEPDELIFDESWAGGEHFRSGMLWKLGRGYVLYFRPGHETYHVYTEPLPMKIVENACAYLGQKVQAFASRPSFKGVLNRMLVFSKTSWYRHPAIPMVDDWFVQLGAENGFNVNVTEDPTTFT